jgi:hypothetical protein
MLYSYFQTWLQYILIFSRAVPNSGVKNVYLWLLTSIVRLIIGVFSLYYIGHANITQGAILVYLEVSSGAKVCVLQQVA